MSTGLRMVWSLHVTGHRLPVLEGSTFGFDRNWAPRGAGSLVVPMQMWQSLNMRLSGQTAAVLQIELLPYAEDGATMADSTFTGGIWPAVEPPAYYRGEAWASGPSEVTQRSWYVYLHAARIDALEGTATVQVATIERQYVETRNGGEPWRPPATGTNGRYILADVWRAASTYSGVPMLIEWDSVSIDPENVPEWDTGESLWDWLNAVREAAGVSYDLDPETGAISFVPRINGTDAPLPDGLLTLEIDQGGAPSVDGFEYADAVTVVWTWTDNNDEEQTLIETRYAQGSGITDWRAARALARIEKKGPPRSGVAQAEANARFRLKTVRTGTAPMSDALLLSLHETGWTTLTFTLQDAPSVTITSIGA